jgi:hypothetical protein
LGLSRGPDRANDGSFAGTLPVGMVEPSDVGKTASLARYEPEIWLKNRSSSTGSGT